MSECSRTSEVIEEGSGRQIVLSRPSAQRLEIVIKELFVRVELLARRVPGVVVVVVVAVVVVVVVAVVV